MPLSAPLRDGSSMNVGGDRMLVFTPESVGDRHPGAGLAVAPAVRHGHHPRHDGAGAWYAVCVRDVATPDRAAKELTEPVLSDVRTQEAPMLKTFVN